MNMRLRPVVAQAEPPAEGRQGRFHLEYGTERTALDPGRTWIQVDRFKWVTRGVIEPPQSFSVHPDGSVDFNGDTFRPDDPEAAGRLTEQINKRHASAAPATRGSPTSPTSPTSHTDTPGAGRLPFRVRLDPLGHLLIEARRGDERTETGLRGLEHLAVDGWLRRPGQIHVDPLQRYLELDGRRFDCTAEGAAELEDALNRLYAPAQTGNHDAAIEVRENPAASSGFDIRFWILRAGTRFEVHGHLSQEKLDILQDHDRCDLLQPGVLLRLSPPFLYLRRRRSDGGEEPIPGLPDVKYRGITASELQRILNHPSLRRSGGARDETPVVDALPQSPASLRVVRHPEDHHHLWLEIVGLDGRTRQRALTHPNLVELQNSGCFREGIDVALSLDQAELSLHQAGAAPRTFALSAATDSATLETLSGLLTGALRPPSSPAGDTHPAGNSPAPESPPAAPPKVLPQAAVTPLPARPSPKPPPVPPPPPGPPTAKAPPPPVLPRPPAAPDLDPGVRALFHEADPHRVNEEIFRVLSERMHLPVQDLLLSLPHVFEDRRFEVLDFQGDVIESVLQLRSGRFYGLYLTHIGPERIDLVYACHGTHIEWGTDKCAFQPGAGAETLEWRGPGLLGLAQDPENRFVFIVRDRYLDWIKPHERVCTEAFALFRTVGGWATERDRMPLIWPVAPMPAG